MLSNDADEEKIAKRWVPTCSRRRIHEKEVARRWRWRWRWSRGWWTRRDRGLRRRRTKRRSQRRRRSIGGGGGSGSTGRPRVNKVAFLFLTAKQIPQHPIWTKFFHDADQTLYNLYVNANPDTPPQRGVFAGKEIANPVTTHWGKFSMVLASVHLLKTALKDERQRFVLLSDNYRSSIFTQCVT